jgi:hypothetical protein
MRPFQFALYSMIALLSIPFPYVSAEESPQQTSASYVPSLGDMMAAIQLRHAKIWYAAKLKNWDLADYELRQLEANLKQALQVSLPQMRMLPTRQSG